MPRPCQKKGSFPSQQLGPGGRRRSGLTAIRGRNTRALIPVFKPFCLGRGFIGTFEMGLASSKRLSTTTANDKRFDDRLRNSIGRQAFAPFGGGT